jgi:hypothetical protein
MAEKTPSKDDGDKTFTQAELDKIVDERLKRERAKYTDYDDLKAKAARAEKLEDEKKSGDQKLAEQIKSLQDDLAKERHRALVASVGREKDLTERQIQILERLGGATRDELEANADDLRETFGTKAGDGKGADDSKDGEKDSNDDQDGDRRKDRGEPARRPKEKLRSGSVTDDDDKDDDFDPQKVAAEVRRRSF